MNHPIIIIGSGLAGYMLAKELRKLNKAAELVLVTASDGRFYSKPLLSTALAQNKSPEVLAVSSAAEMAQELQALVLTHTEVIRIDAQRSAIELANGQWLSYSQLVLAMGAEVLHAPLAGDATAAVYSVNDLESYSRFRQALGSHKKVAIMGSGLVGCEFTNDLLISGYTVSLITQDEYPLQRLVPAPLGEAIYQAFVEKGVDWHPKRLVQQVNHSTEGYELGLSDGTVVTADLVLSAIGLRPHCHLAHTAGIQTQVGIVVDNQLRTNVANIYALGDCAEVVGQIKQYVAPLLHCARVLAKVLTGETDAVHYPIMPIVVKTTLCPITTQPPPLGIEVKWQISGEMPDYQALCYSANRLVGFALSGSAAKNRMELVRRLGEELK